MHVGRFNAKVEGRAIAVTLRSIDEGCLADTQELAMAEKNPLTRYQAAASLEAIRGFVSGGEGAGTLLPAPPSRIPLQCAADWPVTHWRK